jgi:hypothetical protein
MKFYGYFFCLIALLVAQNGCKKATGSVSVQIQTASPMPSSQSIPAEQSPYPEIELFDEMADEAKDSTLLNYNGFQIRRKTKKVIIEETTKPTELSFAQILRNKMLGEVLSNRLCL